MLVKQNHLEDMQLRKPGFNSSWSFSSGGTSRTPWTYNK